MILALDSRLWTLDILVMVITLIGYRGSGKSSVAKPLASWLGWQVIDADDEIERRAQKAIGAIFADDGETQFRRLESEVMQDLLHRDRLVIAAGGGAVLNTETRCEMRAAGPVVWLQAPADVLAGRIGHDKSTVTRRPDLTSTGGIEEIETVLAARESLYRECASLTVETGGQTVDEIVRKILSAIGPLVNEDR